MRVFGDLNDRRENLGAECVQQEYIEAAEAIATPKSRILVREVLPNLATPLAVETTIRLAWSIAIIAALSFVGFGVQPPSPDWGLMINENRTGLVVQPWSVLAPAFLVAMLYYVPVTMQVDQPQQKLPAWLLGPYQQIFSQPQPA